MILIICCHPYQKSFNHAELLVVEENLQNHHQRYELLDLHADHFNPVYSTKELSLYHQGGTVDPLVSRYLRLLRQAQTVIIIAPVWWNSVSGMLKGFVDKVMKEGAGLSHTVTKWGIHGELANIKHCYLLTTSTSPTFYLRYFCGNALQKIFLNTSLKQLGIQERHWQNFGRITGSSLERRCQYLNRLKTQHFK